MRRSKAIICLFTALFLVLSGLVFMLPLDEAKEVPFSVVSSYKGETQELQCYQNDKDECYVFLPSYMDLSILSISLNTQNPISIDGETLLDGMSCADFKLDERYQLTYSEWGSQVEQSITFIKSDGVATMYIDTESGNMDYIHSEKGNKESGKLSLYTPDGTTDYIGDLESINGRGNATWEDFEKKPYSISLSSEADLLDMGAAQEWILLANASDPSNLRNKIVYDFAGVAGLQYSPDSQFVDLYLNGEYAGLYLLCERNEVHTQRVDIERDRGFLVSLEKEDRLIAQNYTHISTDTGKALRVHYPKNISDETLSALDATWQSVENACMAENGVDSTTGKYWSELIDIDSWVRKYLIEEIFGNLDGGIISQYFYYDGNSDLICAGPVWDYDHALGNDFDLAWNITDPNVLVVNRFKFNTINDNQWFEYLYQKNDFYTRVIELYETEYLPLLNELLNKDIDKYTAGIERAAKLNAVRWSYSGDSAAQTETIKSYLSQHIDFLSSVWLEGREYCQISAQNSQGNDFYSSVQAGGFLTGLPTLEDTETAKFLGWYYTDTDEPFDVTKPIYEDTEIYAKWQDNAWNKVDDILKLAPVGLFAVMLIVLFVVAVKREKRAGGGK